MGLGAAAVLGSLDLWVGLLEAQAVSRARLGATELPPEMGLGCSATLSQEQAVQRSPGSAHPRDGWQVKAGCLFELSWLIPRNWGGVAPEKAGLAEKKAPRGPAWCFSCKD